MPYLATAAIDYTGATPNAYAKLLASLIQAGWEYSETSTVYVESDDLDAIRRGLALLAHGLESPGMLSHLSLTVQWIGAPATPSYVKQHPYAVEQILGMDLPF